MKWQSSNLRALISSRQVSNLGPDKVDFRRSLCESKQTSKLLQYTEERSEHKERVFIRLFDTFKSRLLDIRSSIKRDCTDDELYEFQEVLEEQYRKRVSAYDDLRTHASMINLSVYPRKVDTASACNKDMITHLNYRISEIGVKDFDLSVEIEQLKALKRPYAASVYSAATVSSQHTESRSVKDQAVEVAAELAAKKVHYKAFEVEGEARTCLAKLEAEQRKMDLAVKSQRHKLEMLKTQKEIEESDAKLRILSAAVGEDNDDIAAWPGASQLRCGNVASHQCALTLNPGAAVFSPAVQSPVVNSPAVSNVSVLSESSLALALGNAMEKPSPCSDSEGTF